MFSTFSYQDGNLMIGKHNWSDFQMHVSLIRSFSLGDNIPPQYPTFTGDRMHYHFLFYYLVALLEKLGIRIDIALNILSTLGMFGLLYSIYFLASKLTKSYKAAFLSLIFLVFNSSLSWYYLLNQEKIISPFSTNGLFHSDKFLSFGPWDQNLISGFWNLNIFINQRHLPFSFALVFLVIFLVLYSKKRINILFSIVIVGLLPWINKAALIISMICCVFLFIPYKSKRTDIVLVVIFGGLLSLIGISYLASGSGEGIKFNPGFLYKATDFHEFKISNNFIKWLVYWFMNLGFLPLFASLGWVFIERPLRNFKDIFNEKRIWGIIALFIFAISNIFQFSIDMINNHKLINFSVFISIIYAAFFVSYISKVFTNKFIARLLQTFSILILTLGGVIDIFPIINAKNYAWPDVKNSDIATWIFNNTPKDSIFLNLTNDTNPITIAGRKVFLGYGYFPWSMGYPTAEREKEIKLMMNLNLSKIVVCQMLKQNRIDYIYLKLDTTLQNYFMEVDSNFVSKNFNILFKNKTVGIYSVNKSCAS